jgi:diguanylate cyclase (GGDEF)-like protein
VVTNSERLALYRRTVLERLEQDMTRAQRYATSLSVFVLDIDHFKLVNDHYGHQAGDVVLRDCAALLMRELRESDLAGRLGGEEFLGLLPETALEGAVALANRFRELVGGMVFQIPGGRTLRITVSIGVAQLHQSGQTLVSLLARADNALYDAKKAGRNRVRSR